MKLKNLFKLTILFVLLPVLVFAEDFKSIKIDADIDRDGVAKVKKFGKSTKTIRTTQRDTRGSKTCKA